MNNEMIPKFVKGDIKKLTPRKAIKTYCKHVCCAGSLESWRKCTFTNCPLYSHRIGKRNGGELPSKDDLGEKQGVTPINSEKQTILGGNT